jgi:hypothetical protein
MRVPTGRVEHRIAKTKVIELLRVDEAPNTKIKAVVENVSPGGVRVITDSVCAPGNPVLVDAPEADLKLPARVVYCQRLGDGKFAVGLRLNTRVKNWERPA